MEALRVSISVYTKAPQLMERGKQHDLVGHFPCPRQTPAAFRYGVRQRQQQHHQRVRCDKQPKICVNVQRQCKAERGRRGERSGEAEYGDTVTGKKFLPLWIIKPQRHAGEEKRKILYGPADLKYLRQKRIILQRAYGGENGGGGHADDRFPGRGVFVLFPEKRRDRKHEEDRVGKPVGAADHECIV